MRQNRLVVKVRQSPLVLTVSSVVAQTWSDSPGYLSQKKPDSFRPIRAIRWVFWFLTTGLVFLGGVIISTDDDCNGAGQAGFVFTHFKNRNEIDIDALYQAGSNNRSDSGRYDISWQYRLSPTERSDWGITQELNSVLELNGRWNEGNNTTHQVTVDLQRTHQKCFDKHRGPG